MTPAETRDELLAEHADLRRHLDVVRHAMAAWLEGRDSRNAVRDAMTALADTLRRHNQHEERAATETVRTIDAWGPARVEIMEEAHVREHRELYDALVAVGAAPYAQDGARALAAFGDRFLEHMAREEAAFLNASVLRDDDVSIDAQDG